MQEAVGSAEDAVAAAEQEFRLHLPLALSKNMAVKWAFRLLFHRHHIRFT